MPSRSLQREMSDPDKADDMDRILDYLVPTGLKLGLGRIGFHTFRHRYRAWLDETGVPVGGQQKLMRHAHVSAAMDQRLRPGLAQSQSACRATTLAKVCHSADHHSINKGNCGCVSG